MHKKYERKFHWNLGIETRIKQKEEQWWIKIAIGFDTKKNQIGSLQVAVKKNFVPI